MNRAFSKIWILIILILLVAGSFLAWRNWWPGQEETEVKNLVQQLYKAIEEQNGDLVMTYFTPPETPEEKERYNWLTAADFPEGQRFFRGFLRVKIANLTIKSIKKLDKGKFQVNLTDEFQSYSNADPVGYGPVVKRNIVIIAVKMDNKWLIDEWNYPAYKYKVNKYSGFGQEEIISNNETAHWQTYKSKEYGFEIKFPNNWRHHVNDYEAQQMICFYPGQYPGDCPAILSISWDTTLQKRYADVKAMFEKNYTVTESDISIDGVEGKLLNIENPTGFAKEAFFEKESYIYNFAIVAEHKSLFNQILSTFRFVAPKDIIKTGSIEPLSRPDLQALQDFVDEGHQPWRLDPLLVAQFDGRNKYGFESTDEFSLLSERFGEYAGTYLADVEVKHDDQTYDILLIQPIKIGEGGIWSISSISKQ